MEKVSVFILRVQNKSRITLIIWKQMVLNNTFRLDITLKKHFTGQHFYFSYIISLGIGSVLENYFKGRC